MSESDLNGAKFKHNKRGTEYTVIRPFTLQVEPGRILKDGDILLGYVGAEDDAWVRHTDEFLDGRFTPIVENENDRDVDLIVESLCNDDPSIDEGMRTAIAQYRARYGSPSIPYPDRESTEEDLLKFIVATINWRFPTKDLPKSRALRTIMNSIPVHIVNDVLNGQK